MSDFQNFQKITRMSDFFCLRFAHKLQKFPQKKLQECLIFFCLRFAHKLQKFSQKIYKNVWFFKKKLQECLIFLF